MRLPPIANYRQARGVGNEEERNPDPGAVARHLSHVIGGDFDLIRRSGAVVGKRGRRRDDQPEASKHSNRRYDEESSFERVSLR
jgi:hypothetical protein